MEPHVRDYYLKKGMPSWYSRIGEQHDEFNSRDILARGEMFPYKTNVEAWRNEQPEKLEENEDFMQYYRQCDERYPNQQGRLDQSTLQHKRQGE